MTQHVFEGYRRFNRNLIHQPVGAFLEFACFFSFCADFGIVQGNAKPNELRGIILVIEKLNHSAENDVQFLTFAQFVEAVLAVSYSHLLLPAKSSLDQKEIKEVYASLDRIETERNLPEDSTVNQQLLAEQSRDEEQVQAEDVKHLDYFLSCLKIPAKRYDVNRLIEDRRKRNTARDARYWDEVFAKLKKERGASAEDKGRLIEM